MITFLICVAFLVVGYLVYGKYVAKVFEPDDRTTPAVEINDGVDFVPMPTWKLFLIELLNIAGTYLAQNGKNYKICSYPATFMTAVSVTYFFSAPECLGILWSAMGLGMSV